MAGNRTLREITALRFNTLAGYARSYRAKLVSAEVMWLEVGDGELLATVIVDLHDRDLGVVALAKDTSGRYRAIWCSPRFHEGAEAAVRDFEVKLPNILADNARDPQESDLPGQALDLLTPVVARERFHRGFADLVSENSLAPARKVIEVLAPWFDDADGNFVEQFQTTGFSARLWELYLFAAFSESNLKIDRPATAPDFQLARVGGSSFCVEATTANEPLNPEPVPATEEERRSFFKNYVPTRLAGPLTAKLGRQYWTKTEVAGQPFAIAIQDFHAPFSSTYAFDSLLEYAYGMTWHLSASAEEPPIVTPTRIEFHLWRGKLVQSGFFRLPDSEHISAIITNPSATISKFGRIGAAIGLAPGIAVIATGWHRPAPGPTAGKSTVFAREAVPGTTSETWMQGMALLHNPNALIPLLPGLLPEAWHLNLRSDGTLEEITPSWSETYLTTAFISQSSKHRFGENPRDLPGDTGRTAAI